MAKKRLLAHQVEAIGVCERFLTAKTSRRSALVTQPTGSGKTAVITVISATAARDGPVLVVCPSDALCEQLKLDIGERYWELLEIGEYGPPPEVARIMPSDDAKILEKYRGKRLVLVATMKA